MKHNTKRRGALQSASGHLSGNSLRMALGLIITVQGFETSRYLREAHDADTRISTMRYAQWLSTAIYLAYIGFAGVSFDASTVPLKETAVIAMTAPVATLLPMLLVLIPLMGEQERLRTMLRIRGKVLSQGAIALLGVPLGMLAYAIAQPKPLQDGPLLNNPVVAFIVLTIFTGLMEEILFRGLLPDAAERFFGPMTGMFGASVVFAVFNLGGGLWFAIFALYYGFMFSLIVRRTGSLVGVTIAHGLLNTGLLVIWPQVWG